MSADRLLMKGLKNKSEAAFKELYDKYFRLVYYQSYLILHSKEDSEDVTQDVFIKFYNKVDELPLNLNIKNYIASMARNASIDLYRKNQNNSVSLDPDDIGTNDDCSSLLDSFNYLLDKDESIILTL